MGKKSRRKRNPVYLQGLNEGLKRGEQEALEKMFDYITERVATIGEVEGIGEKTAWRIHKHLLEGMESEDDGK